MLSYQHAYHAGNFADVHKHLTLHGVINHLLRKESSITYIDTHAGRGLYPLAAEETARLHEYRLGVLPLWESRRSLSTDGLLHGWLAALAEVQSDPSRLSHYPGSPWWMSRCLRSQDRQLLFELHPGEHEHLTEQTLDGAVRKIHGDGLKGLVQRLPVKTPRLCVLIDPSYERKQEYVEVADTLSTTLRKARHAVIMVWYPLLPAGRHHELLEAIKAHGLRKVWRSEFMLHASKEGIGGMYGSGMLITNPPWGLDKHLAEAMARVAPLLSREARYQADWWVGE
ncbi:23S rRNA (adenine(2030)-N(6))-methyltransferase RlmJ [Halomonas marinisediminis]|uniref:Ribosomal RNA large subunit methyltransferase J n=1 Tax=Halomonas marinisediminis TaxID=2546095 RepID=A0ABY2D614_9GAMM|nr:23S rRNA (adenine(2030)-N(6))-methyltransferase RlmJ [Halomonas marinisediminis]TDB02199.1 23S rRNA (adenine(2030)-N(6))-methyltransferase RlmJ [Halomonas marinisediminis]